MSDLKIERCENRHPYGHRCLREKGHAGGLAHCSYDPEDLREILWATLAASEARTEWLHSQVQEAGAALRVQNDLALERLGRAVAAEAEVDRLKEALERLVEADSRHWGPDPEPAQWTAPRIALHAARAALAASPREPK